MYKEKKYVVAAYQERYFNFYMQKWGDWTPCSKAYYDHCLHCKSPGSWQVRELYALED